MKVQGDMCLTEPEAGGLSTTDIGDPEAPPEHNNTHVSPGSGFAGQGLDTFPSKNCIQPPTQGTWGRIGNASPHSTDTASSHADHGSTKLQSSSIAIDVPSAADSQRNPQQVALRDIRGNSLHSVRVRAAHPLFGKPVVQPQQPRNAHKGQQTPPVGSPACLGVSSESRNANESLTAPRISATYGVRDRGAAGYQSPWIRSSSSAGLSPSSLLSAAPEVFSLDSPTDAECAAPTTAQKSWGEARGAGKAAESQSLARGPCGAVTADRTDDWWWQGSDDPPTLDGFAQYHVAGNLDQGSALPAAELWQASDSSSSWLPSHSRGTSPDDKGSAVPGGGARPAQLASSQWLSPHSSPLSAAGVSSSPQTKDHGARNQSFHRPLLPHEEVDSAKPFVVGGPFEAQVYRDTPDGDEGALQHYKACSNDKLLIERAQLSESTSASSSVSSNYVAGSPQAVPCSPSVSPARDAAAVGLTSSQAQCPPTSAAEVLIRCGGEPLWQPLPSSLTAPPDPPAQSLAEEDAYGPWCSASKQTAGSSRRRCSSSDSSSSSSGDSRDSDDGRSLSATTLTTRQQSRARGNSSRLPWRQLSAQHYGSSSAGHVSLQLEKDDLDAGFMSAQWHKPRPRLHAFHQGRAHQHSGGLSLSQSNQQASLVLRRMQRQLSIQGRAEEDEEAAASLQANLEVEELRKKRLAEPMRQRLLRQYTEHLRRLDAAKREAVRCDEQADKIRPLLVKVVLAGSKLKALQSSGAWREYVGAFVTDVDADLASFMANFGEDPGALDVEEDPSAATNGGIWSNFWKRRTVAGAFMALMIFYIVIFVGVLVWLQQVSGNYGTSSLTKGD